MKRFGKLLYDANVLQWRFEDSQGAWWLKNGESVAFHLGDRYLQGRIGHDETWHITLGDVRFILDAKEAYAVRIER
ncbi:DUF5348 domain-containing protein [Alicyclobacillus sp. SP_1]|uniref:DUF5348 domain-containing protein n=1 Tax=Alicyclobacillus sp. SP_1 TaxID=2942475 RepID=UPI0021572CEF|nr:DUF5348 domain-containing protein [Alicyclobacillus sp. SP_1]